MKFLVINGPNLNLLGKREPHIYGNKGYEYLVDLINNHCKKNKTSADIFQSNHEGEIIDWIHQSESKYDAIIINPGAFTHYSYAIYDALQAIDVPSIEVHLSNIFQREEFRHHSVIAPACIGSICGLSLSGYLLAMDYFLQEITS